MSEEDNTVVEYEAEHVLDPDFYLHMTILQAIRAPHRAIQSGNARDGLISLIIAVDQLERIARASNRLKEKDMKEYEEAVKKFEIKVREKEKDELLRKAMIANYKLELLLRYIFKSLPKTVEVVL